MFPRPPNLQELRYPVEEANQVLAASRNAWLTPAQWEVLFHHDVFFRTESELAIPVQTVGLYRVDSVYNVYHNLWDVASQGIVIEADGAMFNVTVGSGNVWFENGTRLWRCVVRNPNVYGVVTFIHYCFLGV